MEMMRKIIFVLYLLISGLFFAPMMFMFKKKSLDELIVIIINELQDMID